MSIDYADFQNCKLNASKILRLLACKDNLNTFFTIVNTYITDSPAVVTLITRMALVGRMEPVLPPHMAGLEESHGYGSVGRVE